MRVGIIGAGLTGLSAGLQLCKSHEVVIFEKSEAAGGCMVSKKYGQYELETLYHHCFSGDTHLLSLLESLNLKSDLLWLKGSTGYYQKEKLAPVTTPFEILRWGALSFFQKARLGFFVLSSRNIDEDALDKITAKEYLYEKVGKDIYDAFFAPLLSSKFGEMKDEVSAAWLMSRIAIRSDRGTEGERLGYLKGGWHVLIDAMCTRLCDMGADLRLNTPVTRIERAEKWLINGEEFDCILSTIPPQAVQSLGVEVDDAVQYQGAACMTLGLKKDPAQGIYWTNMGDKAPYGAVVVHTNFVPYEWYGEHVVYLASYFKDEPAENLKELMLDDFCKRFDVSRADITHADLYIDRYAGPVFTTGYKENMPPMSYGDGFYSAGMFSQENYPERSMEGSIAAGLRAAKMIEAGK